MYQLRQIIEASIVPLMSNPNSSHVIIKCINCFNENKITYIYDLIKRFLFEIATNKFGCSSLQKCLEICSENQKSLMISKIVKLANNLVVDTYGNYVLLNVISMKNAKVIKEILDKVISNNNIKDLCKSKVSSCVVEKCMDNSDQHTRDYLIEKFKKEDLLELILDPQGFYSKFIMINIFLVCIKILLYANEQIYSIFLQEVKINYLKISNNVIGVRFLNKLQAVAHNIAEDLNPSSSSVSLSGKMQDP